MAHERSRHPALDLGASQEKAADEVPHILLVEDDDQMRSMVAQTLRQQGYEVTECPDGFHWLDFCAGQRVNDESIRYDLVISDIRMPGVSGLDLLEGLVHSHRNPPTILITAFGDEDTHERAAKLGAKAVLDKPFAMQDLVRTVRAHCRRPPGEDTQQTGGDDLSPGNGSPA